MAREVRRDIRTNSDTRGRPPGFSTNAWRMVCISLYKSGKTLKRQSTLHGQRYEVGVIHHNRESGRKPSAGIDISMPSLVKVRGDDCVMRPGLDMGPIASSRPGPVG